MNMRYSILEQAQIILYLAVYLPKTSMMGVASKCNFKVKIVNKKLSRDMLHTKLTKPSLNCVVSCKTYCDGTN